MPLITIIVPTYNRAVCLTLLLRTLANELKGIEDRVQVIIGDNASIDKTPVVIAAFLIENPSWKVLRHRENLGPDENFCTCIDNVKSRFLWIIGDDDLPKKGVLRRIVSLLDRDDPDILYLNSEWSPRIYSPDDGIAVSSLTVRVLSQEAFAKKVNVWVTFISGMVVNLERLYELNPELNIRQFTGTNLVQLGWILPLLMTGSKFQIANQRCILATGGNTGGYRLLAVFAKNFPDILETVCDDNLIVRNAIESKLVWCYIPGLLWMSRFGKSENFADEDILESLSSLKNRLAYWVMLLPLVKLNKFSALPFYLLSKVLAR